MVLVVLLGIAAVAAVWRLRRGKTGPEVKTGSAANINEDLVAYSSQIICIRRAVESAQENPLFIDPLAAILAGDYKGDGKRSPRISIRTKYFDDFMESAVSTGTVKQIVLPAAGMDSRAYRLLVPEDATTYEIDQKIVVETKEKLIAEVGRTRWRC
uniref:[Phosphatase 2A protein]-leucine-carboxy methyltransferase 1 n=1 Tax=Rhodosorus marinus TaxID=101924 RepID=A0A7S3A9I9_9RHOD|mmetsp:Transcript_8217/g.36654  ORF Transcript_8217/g.36654 Transcript_8217/m.36654 type:complete len:156 (+) Transcript_8217:955-1422(+)